MTLDAAQDAADQLAADLAEKFSIDYGWEGNIIHFERPGVDGTIEVNEEIIHIRAQLGLLLMFLQSRIEEEIFRYLGSHFGCEFD